MLDSCSGLTLEEALGITRYAKSLKGCELTGDMLEIFNKAESARLAWINANLDGRREVTDSERTAIIITRINSIINQVSSHPHST
jgi:hypothetical protein